MTDTPQPADATSSPSGAPRRNSCTAAPCGPPSPRPRRRCSSPRATSTPPPSRPRSASRARPAATSTAATPTPPSPCSRSACGSWKAPRRPAPRPPAWPPSPPRCCASSRPATTSWRRAPCSDRAATWWRTCVPASASPPPSSMGATPTPGRRPCVPTPRPFFFETPANPTLDLVDIAAVSEIAHAAGALVVVDNVFATPMLQKPLKLGADVVVYSTTKHVDGQGRCLGGMVLGSEAFVKDHLHNFLKHTGPSLSPFNAWVMLKGLETLPVARARPVRDGRQAGRPSGRAAGGQARAVLRPLRPSAGGARPAADDGTRPGGLLRARGRQAGGLPLRQCPAPRQDLQQSGRCQEPRSRTRPPPPTSA